jgi:hypothetical protein
VLKQMSEFNEGIDWTPLLEDYFSSSGEKCHCLTLLHKQSESLYNNRRNWIDLPVIVGSALIGFLNAGSSSMFDDPKISSIALGIGSLAMGILNSFGTYFGWSKRAEGHRISAIQYAKLYRFLKIEMALPRNQRISPTDLLKRVKDDYDRLAEISPIIPDIVINDFKKKFGDHKYDDISKPEETNGLEKIVIYENPLIKKSSFLQTPVDTPHPLSLDSSSVHVPSLLHGHLEVVGKIEEQK